MKYLIIGMIIGLGLLSLTIFQYFQFNDGKLHIVFCDVGQGDAIFIRTPNNTTMLIDGGPNRKVLSCLSNHLPFWEKTIDQIILTHPHADHYVGFLDVLQNYTIKQLITEKLQNTAGGFQTFQKAIAEQKIPVTYVLASDTIKTKDGITLSIVGPSKEFLEQTSPNGEIGESKEFASIETLLMYGEFSILFTGDSQTTELYEAITNFGLRDIDVFQAAHHGSATGFDEYILSTLSPKLVVISVGKTNRYGHPVPSLLSLLEEKKIPFKRTDQDGEVEIVSDGKNYTLSNN